MRADVVTEAGLDTDAVVRIVRALAELPGAAGRERARADRLAELLAPRAAAAGIDLDVQPFAAGTRANVVLGPVDGADLAFVGHLDSSLGDDPEHWLRLCGRGDRPAPVTVRDGVLEGMGVGVALAPSVAAAITAIDVHTRLRASGASGTVGALVTAGGTHRAVPPGALGGASVRDGAAVGGGSAAGLRELARTGALPRAAINAKGGAPGPLHVEPGSLYLLVEVHGDWGPVLAHPADAPLAGAPACLGALVDAIEAWRCAHIAVARASTGDGTIATDVAIGALDAGLAAKPDLVPAGVRVHLHVVTLPGDNPDAVASSLAAALCAAPRLAPFHDRIQVMPYGELPAGRTAVAHPLVRAADRAWRAVLGDHDVRDWRGATDGAYLRHVGVPTVRIGPPLSSDPEDRRRERVRLDDLRAIASVWTRTAVDHLTGTA